MPIKEGVQIFFHVFFFLYIEAYRQNTLISNFVVFILTSGFHTNHDFKNNTVLLAECGNFARGNYIFVEISHFLFTTSIKSNIIWVNNFTPIMRKIVTFF